MVLWVGWAHLHGSCLGSIMQLPADVRWGCAHRAGLDMQDGFLTWLLAWGLAGLLTRASARGLPKWLGFLIAGHWVPREFIPRVSIPEAPCGSCKWTPPLDAGEIKSCCRRGYGIGDNVKTIFGKIQAATEGSWESALLAETWRQKWLGKGKAIQAVEAENPADCKSQW